MSPWRGAALYAVAVVVAFAASGCRAEYPLETRGSSLSVREARKQLRSTFAKNLVYRHADRPVSLKIDRRSFSFPQADGDCSVSFAGIRDLKVMDSYGNFEGFFDVNWEGAPFRPLERGAGTVFPTKVEAMRFAEALLALREAASAPDTEEADFQDFLSQAKAWIASNSRPPMPDAVLADKATAEDAFKRKDFQAALDAYGDALDRHPMWPEGHYNAALLAGEVEDFELAAHHMRRYLALSPDAKDAAASKEKYLFWRRKARS